MAERSIEQGKHLKALRTTPLRKVTTTDDVAQACLFFASNKTAGNLTGTVLMVHGRMKGRLLWQENLQ
jgi:NAD(P)-dependent dehydrogenase (short-subunit alcohol dehydrogenase family)